MEVEGLLKCPEWTDAIFDRMSKSYHISIDMPKTKIYCSECHGEIIGLPYFCPELKRFYHKNCLCKPLPQTKSLKRHDRWIIMTHDKPEHFDFPVVISWKKKKVLPEPPESPENTIVGGES